MSRRTLTLAAVAIMVAVTGCGYGTYNLYRDDIRTVYVEFFGNDTFRRRLEVPLTNAIVEEIKLRTPLEFARREEADSVLAGRIVSADLDTRVKTEEDVLLLQDAAVEVEFSWRDRLTGREIVPAGTIVETARVPRLRGNQPFDAASEETVLFEIALQEAARRIVENMEQNW